MNDQIYKIVVINDQVTVGCKTYTIEEWLSFSEYEIYNMDEEKAVNFYNNFLRSFLLELKQ